MYIVIVKSCIYTSFLMIIGSEGSIVHEKIYGLYDVWLPVLCPISKFFNSENHPISSGKC